MVERAPNIAIVTAYNDMLSAHQPYQAYPDLLRDEAARCGATVQVAGACPQCATASRRARRAWS